MKMQTNDILILDDNNFASKKKTVKDAKIKIKD